MTEHAELSQPERELLLRIAGDPVLIEIARRHLEDTLIMMRDSRMFALGNNGLVCKEKNGASSSTIRITTTGAVKMALCAIGEAPPERITKLRGEFARYLERKSKKEAG
jgi:hypothetical protein